MKTLLSVIVVSGIAAGLVVYLMPENQHPARSRPETVPATTRSVLNSSLSEKPRQAALARSSPSDGSPLPLSPEERSQQLQLEIEQALVSIDDAQRERAYTQLIPALIAIDPAAVKRIIESYPAGPGREELLRHTARAWSATNVDGAIDWVADMTENGERTVAAAEVVAQIGQFDPARAVDVSDRFGIGRNDGTVDRIVQLWAVEKLQEALAWVEAKPAGPQRDQLLARITSVQAQTAPADAANTALTQITPGSLQDAAIASLIDQWSIRDSDAASAWVEDLPKGHIQDLARSALAQSARQHAMAVAQGWAN